MLISVWIPLFYSLVHYDLGLSVVTTFCSPHIRYGLSETCFMHSEGCLDARWPWKRSIGCAEPLEQFGGTPSRTLPSFLSPLWPGPDASLRFGQLSAADVA